MPPPAETFAPALATATTVDGVSERPSDDKQRSDFLWNVQKYTSDYVRFADTKAAAILVFCSGLIGVMYTSKHPARLLSVALVSWTAGDWMLVAAMSLLAAALICVGMAIIPRLSTRQSGGMVYWESILEHGTGDAYWKNLTPMTATQLSEQLAHNVFDLAGISRMKYRWVNRGLRLAAVGGAVAAIVMVAV